MAASENKASNFDQNKFFLKKYSRVYLLFHACDTSQLVLTVRICNTWHTL